MAFDTSAVFAQRIGGANFGKDTTEYKFARFKRLKKEAVARGAEVIDFGVGEHDGEAPLGARTILCEEVHRRRNRGYPDNGIIEFQQAAARYMNRTFDLSLPTDEHAGENIIHSIGSKGALSLLPLALVNPGDAVVMTVPGYPVFGTHARYLGAEVLNVPLEEKNDFLPELGNLDGVIRAFNGSPRRTGRVKALVINAPNNPTGADGNPAFWQSAANLAHKYNLFVVQDAAYADLVYDGRRPTGILQARGGLECGIQVHSMSKGNSMIGWRLGFVVSGNKEIIAAYGNVKDNSDSGQFAAIQRAAAHALDTPEYSTEIARKYSRRLDSMVEMLRGVGFNARKPAGSFFLYVKAPSGAGDVKFRNADEAAQHLLTRGDVATVPWDEAGPYLRFSATFEAGPGSYEELGGDASFDQKVIDRAGQRLKGLNLRFD